MRKRALAFLLILCLSPLGIVWAENGEELAALDVAIVLTWESALKPEDMPFFSDAAREAGVEIRFHTYTPSAWANRKGMILESSNLPDIFINCISQSDFAQYRECFARLDSLIADCAPNIARAYEEDAALRSFSTEIDGHIYGLAQRRPFRPNTWRKWTINKVWLENLGLPVPRTFAELKQALRAFRDEDANQNGDPGDEIPLAFNGPLAQSYLIMGAFGNYSDSRGLSCKDGEFIYLAATEDWRRTVEFLCELYQEGLLYGESLTVDYQTWKMVGSGGEVARLGASYCWSANDMVGPLWENQYIVIDQIAADENVEPISSYQPYNNLTYGRHCAHISATCENPEAAIRFLDLFYREDYSVQATYGSFGVGSRKNADGTYSVLVPPSHSDEEWQRINSIVDGGLGYFSEELESRVTPPNSAIRLLEDEKTIRKTVAPEDGNAYYLVKLDDETIRESALILQSLDNISQNMLLHSLVNGVSDESWNRFLEQLEAAGMRRLTEIYQQAYDEQSRP